MSDYSKIIAALSPEKRALLELKLKKQGNNYNSFPLSFAQQRLWFIDQLEPGSPIYNIPSAFRLEGLLDIPALEKAINEVVRRHEILRTSYTSLNGQPIQVVAPDLKINLPLTDLQGLSQSEQEKKVQALATEEAKLPFDLTRVPLIRAKLIKLAEDAYVVLLTMHHIISDGWSIGILMREIAVLYDAISRGKPSPLLPLKFQYVDFAKWQQQYLQGEKLEKQLAYWKEKLGTNPPVLELPTDYPRPARLAFEGSSLPFELPKDIVTGLNQIGRQEGATLFMTLLAGFQTLLHRYTGQGEISVGSPIANRTRSETENLIGFFVNTLVLHTDLSGDPTFRELMARVKETTLGAYANQDVPFEKLVEALQPERDMSHTPLFQVMFVLQNTPVKTMKLPNLTLRPFLFDRGVTQFDLTFNMVESEHGLKGFVEYNTNLFEPTMIKRMIDHFGILLQSVVNQPDQSISSLPILTSSEKIQLLEEWNATESFYPEDKCLHHLFEDQAKQNPQAFAIAFKNKRMTYSELDYRANQLARYLKKRGVGSEVLVGICVERSFEMIVGIMGILKAGGAYVPIDPNYPSDRIDFILKDTQTPVLLTKKSFLDNLPANGSEVICLDTDWETISQESSDQIISDVIPENLAYVIYTSGSTGIPKGVQLHHEGVINLVNEYIKIFECKPDDNIGQFFSYSFDGSVGDIFMALCSGATLCLVDDENRIPGPGLNNLMREMEMSIFIAPPSILTVLPDDNLSKLRAVGAGGENPSRELINRWTCNGRPFFNLYGPTEATVIVTSYLLNNLPPEAKNMLLGRPIGNIRLYIVDSKLNPVPIGVPGELVIGGIGLAHGYLKRPEVTAEKFIPDPFGTDAGGRLYKTGDLARFLADGNIEFLGRIDHQVKVRGFRIELGEIEAAITDYPKIKDSLVVVREDIAGSKLLVAYLMMLDEEELNVSDLKNHLKAKLPEYMVPSAFVCLDKFPLTPNGKIDRKALPAPDWSQRDLRLQYLAPRTPVEEMLATVYARILKVDRVSATDNFFDLGGHSLLATQVISRIREVLNVELPLRDLFEAPVLGDLALRVEQAQRQSQELSAPPIVPVSREKELPLSFAQQRLWFLDQLDPESPLYNIPMGFRLKGKLDIEALQQSINAIVQRHENLRSSFQTADGKARIEIAASLSIPLPLIDLQELPESDREQSALKLATEEIKRPFKLNESPLLRTVLYRLNEADHIIVLTMHHIISDGWSSGVLIQEMAALYDSFSDGRSSSLPDLKIQYADFAYWQRNWLQGEVLEKQLDYWNQQLADSPALLELPTDFPRLAVQTSNGAHYTFELSKELSDKLIQISRQEGVTQFMTMLAAFQTLLSRYSGQDDICVGTPIANRNRSEIENLIGFFVNTLVLRTKLSSNFTFKQLLSRVRETTLGAYAHQDLPFEKVVDAVQPERNMSHSPLFQVMFMLQNAAKQEMSVEGLSLSSIALDTGISTFDLTLSLFEGENGFSGAFEYNTDLFKEATIARMVDHFQMLLQQIAENPDRKLSDLSILTADQKRTIIEEWNDTSASYSKDKCIHQHFEAQADRTPDAVAVIYEDQQLSYRELNQRANQLAHTLKNYGIEPDMPVGICLNRSLEMMVGLLGILKSGGCYLPLDPNYPEDRLAFMIEDSNVSVLVTQQNLVNALPKNGVKVICLDSDWDKISESSSENLEDDSTPKRMAYLIYTSGSTGRPKGVMVEHQSVVNHNLACIDQFQLKPGDRVLQFATINFDTAVEEIFPTLLSGATLVLRSADGVLATGADLMKLVEKYGLTVLDLPTAYWHEWVFEMTLQIMSIPDSLRLVIVGGDKTSAERFATWRKMVGTKVQWLNTYGPTEGTIIATAFDPDDGRNSWQMGSEVPIGRPIANSKIHILDRQMQPVSVGVKGYLHIGGASVARGYLNRPDLTAEKFVPDPFSHTPGARLYDTGDLARYFPDGNIEFIGRADHQVKIRGFRIELSEIEAELEKHPLIQEAVVVAKEETPSSKRLVAYCVPVAIRAESELGKRRHVRVPFLSEASLDYNGNQTAQFKTEDLSEGGARLMTISPIPELDSYHRVQMAMKLPIEPKQIQLSSDLIWKNGERIGVAFHDMSETNKELIRTTIDRLLENKPLLMNELRNYLKERLPDYMVPATFMILDRLPRTPSNKIDRKALPEPDFARIESDGKFILPRNEAEQKLAEIWSKVLRIEKISVNDNFFELGGDSILSIQVIAQANQAGLQLTPKQIFEHPTIAGLASVAGTGQAIQAEQGAVTGEVLLTPIQRWFFDQDSPELHHYNQSVFFEVKQRLEPEILRQAIGRLYQHHDALRLRYRHGESGWEQFNVDFDGEAPFDVVDLSTIPVETIHVETIHVETIHVETIHELSLHELSIQNRKTEIEKIAASTQASLKLEHGPIMKVVLFDAGENYSQRLLIVIHHLAIDGVSWRILLEDLQTIYGQIQQGKPAQLPLKTTSFQYWANKLANHAQSPKLLEEMNHWSKLTHRRFTPLPIDFPGGENIEASAQTLAVSLSKQETEQLLKEVPAVYHTQINDVLLTALAQAYYRLTGSRQVMVELEGHGREDLFNNVDLSRTIGWFTSVYPVLLDLKFSKSPGEAVKTIKEQIRQIPNNGIGFGLLRYLNEDTEIADQLKVIPRAEICFNYLGQFDQVASGSAIFDIAKESKGSDHSPLGKRSHVIEINGSIAGGKLQLDWSYSDNLHRRATIERLAQHFMNELKAIIAHCTTQETGEFTPSDFTLVKLDQKKLDKVMKKLGKGAGLKKVMA